MPEAPLSLRLHAVTYAAADTCLYEFRDPDGAALPPYEPGAHIDVHMPGGLQRQYSLARPYEAGKGYLVGIKLDRSSRGGSRYMIQQARPGQTFEVGGPRNHFPLKQDAPHTVLFAGGIGVTPIWCMAQRLEALGASFELHYAVRERTDAAFLDRLERMAPRVRLHVDVEAEGVLDVAALVNAAPADAHLYCCGPGPMMDAFVEATAGCPEDHIHVEYFTAPVLPPPEGGFTVVLAKSGRELLVPEGKTILDTLRAAGVSTTSSCEQGVCGACETRVIEGVPYHHDILLTPAEKAAGKTMMICCSGSLSDRLVLDL